MSRGDKPYTAMTYREWLIGQIANGLAANPRFADTLASSTPPILVNIVINNADDIIRRLDSEQEHPEQDVSAELRDPEIPF